jgi:hypothetical protein
MALAFITEGSIGMLAPGDEAVHPDLLRLVTEIVRRGQSTGELDTRLAPDFIAWLIVTALAAATASWLVRHEQARLDRTTADTLDVLLAGLTGARNSGSLPPPGRTAPGESRPLTDPAARDQGWAG